MELTLDLEKGRKSVGRIDGEISDKKKDKMSLTIEELGLENFKDDLLSTKVVKKSSENLIVDLEKAGTKHLPKKAERYSYSPTSEYGVIYIPINRLKKVYQTDKASNPKKVKELVKLMKNDKKLDPIEIGYNYDVHDGHHRWEASIEAGYTHVPCKVVGTDSKKVKQAKKEYRKLWKSMDVQLVDTLESRLRDLVLLNMTDEDQAIQAYAKVIELLEDGEIRDIILEIMEDELDHYHNLSQVLRFMEGDEKALDKQNLKKSEDLALVVDLFKSRKLDKSKLVQMRVPVRGKGGKTFYRMQWVNPHKNIPEGAQPVKNNHSTFRHSKKGISEMEKRQSNRFPILHYPTKDLKNTVFNYQTDLKAYNEALANYYDGNELPYVKISPTGEILDNHHLVDMAKNLGLSHVPTIVVGNPRLKKELEDRLKPKVVMEDEEGNEEVLSTRSDKKDNKIENLSEEVIREVEKFKNGTKRKYPKQYLMEQAEKQGIKWNSYTKAGKKLPAESNILWMRAHQAIISHIEQGNVFAVEENKTKIKEHMDSEGKDGVEPYFLQVMEQFGYDKEAILEHARKTGINWKEKKDPDMNWMYGVMAIKDHMRGGGMFAGIRTRQKNLIKEQQIVVTDQIKQQVTSLKEKHGKQAVMEKANLIGITWDNYNKKGIKLPAESKIRWMRAHQAISRYIAEGNEFHMSDNPEDSGLKSTVNENLYDLTKHQLFAMDVGRRNTKKVEEDHRNWALNVFKIDRGVDKKEAEELYDKFMENARKAKVMIQFNPFEQLPNGTTLIDQLISDNKFKNDYAYERGYDYEHKGSNENDMFTDDYWDAPDEERPVYGIIDLFNRGLDASTLGDVSIVLKDNVKGRSTGSHIDADSIPYGKEGTTVRSMEDPHHLIIDRWRERWKNPNKKDNQRIRAMNSILEGTKNTDDIQYFEAHIHGSIDLSKDVDYILVPQSWKTDKEYEKHLSKMKELSNITGASIKYE